MTSYAFIFTVDTDAIDRNGHVNNVTYLQWMIDAATKHSESVGFGYKACQALGGTWVAKSHLIKYKHPAFEGEVLEMQTWIEEIGKILSTRHYRITRQEDQAVILEGKTDWVFVDSKTMRPKRVPQVLKLGFENR